MRRTWLASRTICVGDPGFEAWRARRQAIGSALKVGYLEIARFVCYNLAFCVGFELKHFDVAVCHNGACGVHCGASYGGKCELAEQRTAENQNRRAPDQETSDIRHGTLPIGR